MMIKKTSGLSLLPSALRVKGINRKDAMTQRRKISETTLVVIFIFFLGSFVNAQSMRSLINEGVDNYKDKKFADSEVNFKKGLEKTPESFEANFNLGDAYYKQERYDEALNSFQAALGQAQSKEHKAAVHHNIGNSLLKSQKIKESIEAYKKALKLNPDDSDTKYNLSYAMNLLNQQQNQQQQNKDDQNKDNKDNQDKQQNQDQNQDKNKQDKDKQDQQQQNQQDQQNPKNEETKQDNLKQKEEKLSKEEAERILQALKNNEKDLQKKLRKQKGVPVKTDKDW
ncbi:MAG: tetratricopeptide repeat protein [Ignavibacteriaceae bacterium]